MNRSPVSREMHGYITIRMTPRQAAEAERFLSREGAQSRALAAAGRLANGLMEAGWEWDSDHQQWTKTVPA